MEIHVTDGWREQYPDACVGILAMDGVQNPAEHPALTAHAAQIEAELRRRWSGATRAELNQLPEFEAYRAHYRRFEKTYHVQLQHESVALKGKPLRSQGALVLAMFAAELQDRLLTAGHDFALIQGDLTADVARGGEPYSGIGGRELTLRAGDLYVHDTAGVLSSVVYGPDERTRLTPETRQVLYCVYGPPGIARDAVAAHLASIAHNVRLVTPQATVLQQQVYPAGD